MHVDDSPAEDSRFEDQLGEALRHAGGGFETDRRALAAAGEARGRRLRLRRRMAVTGSVAGLALVGVGGALLVPGADGGEGQAAAGPPKVRSGVDAGTDADADTNGVSGPELLKILKGLLPEGEFSKEEARPTDAPVGPYVHLVYDDGHGKAAVEVGMGRIDLSGKADELTTCPDKNLVAYDSCTTARLTDGSTLMIYQGYEYPDHREDTKTWYAQLVTPQGQQISVNEWNAAAEKGSPVTRANPPLSPAQLKNVVTAKAWRTAVDTIPESPKDTRMPNERPQADGKAVESALVALLPKSVQVKAKGSQESEYAYVVVDDGKGRSMVQINVQSDMSDVEDQLFGSDAETLADGTKVTTRQEPGEKGGSGVVMWTVDTIRTDGMRVVVSAFNSGSQETDATRTTPALTMKELRTIAVSGKWRTLLK
ncbi:hypothetical protein [Streptomyces sp. R35]|uniref:Serine/threonine protein kinase n=1 Tax=Streptomyces sp. R35 TaxID=3238630 RepID=A0AB39SBZ4_9ACTN